MKTPDPIDPLNALLNHRPTVTVRPDFLDRVIAATYGEPQDILPGKIVAFPAVRRQGWRVMGLLAAAAALVVGLFFSLRPSPTSPIASHSSPSTTMQSEDGLEQELTAVEDMQTLIALDDPSQLDDAQLLALLN